VLLHIAGYSQSEFKCKTLAFAFVYTNRIFVVIWVQQDFLSKKTSNPGKFNYTS
jgi:hypothetical protein